MPCLAEPSYGLLAACYHTCRYGGRSAQLSLTNPFQIQGVQERNWALGLEEVFVFLSAVPYPELFACIIISGIIKLGSTCISESYTD